LEWEDIFLCCPKHRRKGPKGVKVVCKGVKNFCHTIYIMSKKINFEQPIFYIVESPLLPNCTVRKTSQIVMDSEKDFEIPQILSKKHSWSTYVMSNPMNIMEVQQYLFDETTKLVIKTQLAKKCDTEFLALNGSKKSTVSNECISTFSPKYEIINENNKGVIRYLSNYSNDKMNPFLNFSYTDSYIQSKQTQNDKKPLCQRYADITMLLSNLYFILEYIKSNSTDFEYDKINDKYNIIREMHEKNKNTQLHLQDKLEQVTKGYYYNDSKQMLDSTVYVSVLWTILATTLLFYVFKKM